MIYRASWRHTSGFGVLCSVGSVVLVLVGALVRSLIPVTVGLLLVVYLYAIGRRLSVRIDEEGIWYQGWLGVKAANWSEVTGVMSARYFPYPRDRYYGPGCYEVRTAKQRFVINLLYFPVEFRREFLGAAQRRGLVRRRRTAA